MSIPKNRGKNANDRDSKIESRHWQKSERDMKIDSIGTIENQIYNLPF